MFLSTSDCFTRTGLVKLPPVSIVIISLPRRLTYSVNTRPGLSPKEEYPSGHSILILTSLLLSFRKTAYTFFGEALKPEAVNKPHTNNPMAMALCDLARVNIAFILKSYYYFISTGWGVRDPTIQTTAVNRDDVALSNLPPFKTPFRDRNANRPITSPF